jgi:hypothetical protein
LSVTQKNQFVHGMTSLICFELSDYLSNLHFTPCWEAIEKVVTARTGSFLPVRGSPTAI